MKKSPIPPLTLKTMLTFPSAVISDLFRQHLLDPNKTNPMQFVRDKRIIKALAYIREHCKENIRIKVVADLIGISVEGLKQLFQRVCNRSFKTIIFEYRIAEVMKLLSTTDEPITNIAFDCGFNCTKTFSKKFREICGMTASEFRKASQMQYQSIDMEIANMVMEKLQSYSLQNIELMADVDIEED